MLGWMVGWRRIDFGVARLCGVWWGLVWLGGGEVDGCGVGCEVLAEHIVMEGYGWDYGDCGM